MKVWILYIIVIPLWLHFPYNVCGAEKSKKPGKDSWEVFHIINYDSDVGFGFGAKGFLYNSFNSKESFDLTLYNSTKGERWYQLAFSIPDRQRRHGKEYGLGLDLIIDYDKWVNYIFYNNPGDRYLNGVNQDLVDGEEHYIREPIEISALFHHPFTANFIAEFGMRFKSVACYKFEPEGTLRLNKPHSVKHISVSLTLRLDTRSDLMNPIKGYLLEISNELARDISSGNESYFRIGMKIQSYIPLLDRKLTLASRIVAQSQSETSFQNLLSLGGNNSIRGLPQDRYLSLSSFLINEELRFPIWWRLGGIVGLDIGNSSSTLHWIINTVAGVRLYMDNFTVRADIWIGKESSAVYFNFGHLF
jgi:outer membrane protein assembly factor BamA